MKVRLQEAWFATLTTLHRSTRIMVLIQSLYKTKTKLITVFVCRFQVNLIEPTICFCAILKVCHTGHRAFPNIYLCVFAYVYSTDRWFTMDSPQNRQTSPSHGHRYVHTQLRSPCKHSRPTCTVLLRKARTALYCVNNLPTSVHLPATPCIIVLLKKSIIHWLLPSFKELDDSLSRSQQPVSECYLESDKSRPHCNILFINDPF